MNTIDPRTPVSEILRLYPGTLEVFRTFNMKCADDSSYTARTLEENFIEEQVNFMDLFSQLHKVINPVKTSNRSSPVKKIEISVTDGWVELEIPPEIGDVTAQHTSIGAKFNLAENVDGWGCIGMCVLLFVIIMLLYTEPLKGAGLLLAVCAVVAAAFFFKKDTVIIVGTEGFVVYKLSRRTHRIISCDLYLFKDVTELVFPQTVQFINNAYTGTSFNFKLLNGENILYGESGKYFNSKNEEGKYGWKFPFLQDIENAWTSFLMKDLIRQLQTEGIVHFNSKESFTENQIEVGRYYLKYNNMIFQKHEIGKVYFEDGMLFIEHKNYESKYWGLKNKGERMSIPVNKMPNKKAFIILVQNLL